MQECTKCGERKDASEFYSGFVRCKACVKQYNKAYRDKKNANKPADWKKKTKDKAAYQRAWLAQKPGYGTEAKKRWYEKNRDRLLIKWRVADAIKAKKLIKVPCLVCGAEKVEAHHPDYSAPLAVVWLCRQHHRQIHEEVKSY